MPEGEIARSAAKILGYGGGTMSLMGGTQDFLDGGDRPTWGGDKGPMGDGAPPSPHVG